MMTAAIVLAAGKSERMGQNKLLMRMDGGTLLDTVLNAIAAADIRETVVVVGHNAEEIIKVVSLKRDAPLIVINRDYAQGMASSFQTGLRLLPYVDAAFLVLGDQPILDKNLLDIMMSKLRDNRETLIVSPIYQRKKGHPVLFRRELFGEILGLNQNETIRDVIHRHAGRLRTVEAPEWTIVDMDTQEDYARIRALMRRGL
ncbi:MAG: nucleotidyltransferase family protein [Halobacteriota archaeon]